MGIDKLRRLERAVPGIESSDGSSESNEARWTERIFIDEVAVTSFEEFRPVTALVSEPADVEIYLAPVLKLWGTPGRRYRIEFSDAASGTDWELLAEIALPKSPFEWVDMSATQRSLRFYRVLPAE